MPSSEILLALVVLLPLLGSAFALVVPAADRLTLRAVGVATGLLALAAGLALLGLPAAVLTLPFVSLRFAGVAVPATLVILGVTPMALRAGAPRGPPRHPAWPCGTQGIVRSAVDEFQAAD